MRRLFGASQKEPEKEPLLAADEEKSKLLDYDSLPPLPDPIHNVRLGQSAFGSTVVIFVCIAGPLSSWAFLMLPERMKQRPETHVAALVLVSVLAAEAVVALICLAGLMFSDPGVVTRSESAHDIPDHIAQLALKGEPMPEENIVDDELGTFCVRCLAYVFQQRSICMHCPTAMCMHSTP